MSTYHMEWLLAILLYWKSISYICVHVLLHREINSVTLLNKLHTYIYIYMRIQDRQNDVKSKLSPHLLSQGAHGLGRLYVLPLL